MEVPERRPGAPCTQWDQAHGFNPDWYQDWNRNGDWHDPRNRDPAPPATTKSATN